MTRRSFIAAISVYPLLAQKDRRKRDQPPEVEIAEFTARRTGERLIEIDGRVRNSGIQPIQKLTLVFHIVSPDGKTLTTQKGTIDDEVLEPGQESTFQWQMRDQSRAVCVHIGAADRVGFELIVRKPGPYDIE